MAEDNIPVPQRAGTDREAREMEALRKLDALSDSDPAAFADLLKLLAQLVVESEIAGD